MHKNLLATIELVVMDVDGTLTDGSMYYGSDGEAYKEFYVRDGMGLVLLQKYGIKTAILTAENSPIIERRAARLHINYLFMGIKTKKTAINDLVAKAGLSLAQTAYIGDDINDLRAMQQVGYACCPNDAHPLIKEECHFIIPFPGGRGAVRYLCDLIIEAKGLSLNPEEPWF